MKYGPFFEAIDNFSINKEVESVCLYGTHPINPQVSVMIPTFLRNVYLKETIQSVIKQSTNLSFEIVVVDNNDNFDDHETLDLIQQFNSDRLIYYKNKKNIGMFGNWNKCIQLAKAQWLLILHDDDTIPENYITRMMEVAHKYPSSGAVGCLHKNIDMDSNPIEFSTSFKHKVLTALLNPLSKRKVSEVKPVDFYYAHPIDIMGILLNKSAAVSVGGFDPRWHPTSDYIFILNLCMHYPVYLVDEYLFNYRIGVNSSLSLNHIIGMGIVNSYMRSELNQVIQALPKKKDRRFRNINEIYGQRGLIKTWGGKLDREDLEKVCEEYSKMNKELGFDEQISYSEKIFSIQKRAYLFFIKYIRKF